MKRKRILAALGVLCALVLSFLVYRWMFPPAYQVGEDEVALYIRLDLEEDIGLIVFDYTVDGREHGGGISNADRSLIRRNEEDIYVWGGRLAQLEEHLVYTERVGSSNLSAPTN